MKRKRSEELYQLALKYLVGGVNSPVRAFRSVGGTPVFVSRGKGAYIYDEDDNEYIDYVCSWGALILGHSHPVVVEAINRTVTNGTSYGAPTRLEIELAELICEAIPSIEKVRLVNSGTEATMSAIRLARAFTNRTKIVKFEGCYHGHSDAFLVKAGSGAMTLGIPDSAGVPGSVAGDTISLPYNNLERVKELFASIGDKIAAVIVEPIAGNMGVVLPQAGFLQGLREVTQHYGALLIFDEVITGFRLMYGGAQNYFQVEPDLTTLGKVIGGGLPVGAYGGKKGIMKLVSPEGPVYQAGTLAGNPLAVSAGIATLKFLKENNPYPRLAEKGARLAQGIIEITKKSAQTVRVNQIGSMLTLFFTAENVIDYDTALTADKTQYASFFHKSLDSGIYLPPSQFESWFISTEHTEAHIEKTLDCIKQIMQ